MSQKILGWILIVGGVVVAVLSLAADAIGLGSGGDKVGGVQILGTVLGVLTVVAGVGALLWKKKAALPPASPETPPAQPGNDPPA